MKTDFAREEQILEQKRQAWVSAQAEATQADIALQDAHSVYTTLFNDPASDYNTVRDARARYKRALSVLKLAKARKSEAKNDWQHYKSWLNTARGRVAIKNSFG